MNHPMPASPFKAALTPNGSCITSAGFVIARLVSEPGGPQWARMQRAADYAEYLVWAANNAPKLADRIKELEARLMPASNGTDYIDHYKARVDALEAALRDIIDTPAHPMRRKLVDIARKALEAK